MITPFAAVPASDVARSCAPRRFADRYGWYLRWRQLAAVIMGASDGAVLLDVKVSGDADALVVRVLGDLDVNSINRFDRLVEDLLARHPRRLVIDMREVGFVDSCGLRSLIAARARMRDRESFVLRSPRAPTRRLLELTGLVDEFQIEP